MGLVVLHRPNLAFYAQSARAGRSWREHVCPSRDVNKEVIQVDP